MVSKYLLLLLPAISFARIDVEITGEIKGSDKTVSVDYTGSDTSVISELERTTFQLDDDTLMANTLKVFGGRPDDVYLHSPTPFGDLYKTYNWEEVTRTLTPRAASILNVSSETCTMASKTFTNNNSRPKTFNLGLTKHLENTVASFWSKDGDLTVNKGINYAIHLCNETISYTSPWGLNTEKATTMLIGSNDTELVLLPGQSVTTELRVTRTSITLQMGYTATLSGTVAVNYRESFNGHHFWSLDLNELMSAGGLTNTVTSKETIDITFYSNPEVVIFDTKTKERMTDLLM